MKLVIFIVVSLCATTATGRADANHARAIEHYRKLYEQQSDPKLLVRIAHEYRKAGDEREALAYFCSYMYVDAAGELADEASANARKISAQLGNPTQSDHDACSPRPPATRAPSVDMLGAVPQRPPRISKREVIGLSGLAGSLAFLGLALYESGKVRDLHEQQRTDDPNADQDALARRVGSSELRQKLYLAGGGALLITGGLLYITGRNARKKAERLMVAPTLYKGGAGVAAGRRF